MKSLRAYSAIALKLPIDLLLLAGSFLAAYWLASVHHFPVPLSAGTPEISSYLMELTIILPAFLWCSHNYQLYKKRRAGSHVSVVIDLLKVMLNIALILFAIKFYFRSYNANSRVILTSFFAFFPVVLTLHHWFWMRRERKLFAKGIGTRSCIIIGIGKLAQTFADQISNHPWTGLSV